jgi:hypothetical protein
LIFAEVALGVWLLSGIAPLGAWLVATATFAAFAIVSSYQGWVASWVAFMKCFLNLAVAPCVLVVFLAQHRSRCTAQEDLKKQFARDAPIGWDGYLRFSEGLQSTYSSMSRTTLNGTQSAEKKFHTQYKLKNNAALRVQYAVHPGTDGEVEGMNPRYTFKLKRASAERGWVLADLKTTDPTKGPTEAAAQLRKNILQGSCACLTLWNLWLPDLLRDSDFKIMSIQKQSNGPVELYRVDFEYAKPAGTYPIRGALPISRGWAIFDPGHDWIMKEYEVFHASLKAQASINRRFEIKQGRGQHPLINHITTIHKWKDGDESGERVADVEVETLDRPEAPVTEFTLSAFGLPEPTGVVWNTGTPYYIWFAGAAAVSLCLALVFRFLARRRAARQTPG